MIDVGKVLRRRIYFIEIRKKSYSLLVNPKSIPCEEINNYDEHQNFL